MSVENLDLMARVKYDNNNFYCTTGTPPNSSYTITDVPTPSTNCYDFYRQYYYPVWPISNTVYYEDKGVKAHKILKALMDKKVINIKTVKQFVDLMDEVIKLL